MAEKAFSVFLCILLVLVLFFPQTEGGGENNRSFMGVRGSPSYSAPSRRGPSSPGGGGTGGVRESPSSHAGTRSPVTGSSPKTLGTTCGQGAAPYKNCVGAHYSNPGCHRYFRGCPKKY